MASITTIAASDVIADSRAVINTNFENLNDDKIETSYLDTDTALTANSDVKIPSQKAVKAYVDSGGQQNASELIRGLVEEATDAEITAGTDTGGTGAKLFAPPSKLNTRINTIVNAAIPSLVNVIGALPSSVVKTFFNIQLPFLLWTGSVANDTTTTFINWVRSSTDVALGAFGAFCSYIGTGADSIYVAPLSADSAGYTWALTNKVILDFWAKLPASGTGDLFMGFSSQASTNGFIMPYTQINSGEDRAGFSLSAAGALYATMGKNGVGITNTDISSGLTLTNFNNYRIELDLGNNVLYYVNGVLKATLSGANLYTGTNPVVVGFGRSNTTIFIVTAPNLALEMNP